MEIVDGIELRNLIPPTHWPQRAEDILEVGQSGSQANISERRVRNISGYR